MESIMSDEQKELSREELLSAREERRLELQQRFNPEKMKVVRKELFANLRDPAVTIRNGNITFNTACINGLEDVIWVNLMIDHPDQYYKKYAVKMDSAFRTPEEMAARREAVRPVAHTIR